MSCLITFIALQTMGGTFSGKQQDCTKGIYALSGWYRMHPFNSTKQMSRVTITFSLNGFK